VGEVRKEARTTGAAVRDAAAADLTAGRAVVFDVAGLWTVLRFFFLELVAGVASRSAPDSSMGTTKFAKRRIVEFAHSASLLELKVAGQLR
jgi:hypothetical protein